jgi:TonB family protein
MGGDMASSATNRRWIRVLVAILIAAVGGSATAQGGPPVTDHTREMLEMATELGFALDYDDAPKPKRITKPTYPKQALEACVEGTVVVLIGIDPTGSVSASKVVESVEGLDEAAVSCVTNWRFKPARKAGVPVGSVAAAPVIFRIYDDAKQQGPCAGKTRSPLQ